MARRIDKESNGNYAVWSTIVDDYLLRDATPEQIIEMYIEESRESIRESVMRQIQFAEIVESG